MDQQNDLIAAIATPEAVSAISVVRLSGRGASATVEKLMNLEQGKLTGRRRAVGDFAGIDYLVAISWPFGNSYTGEEMIDIMCHGSPGTPGRILSKLEESGARIALPGEFTRRAWINGKLTSLDVLTLSSEYQGDNRGDSHRDLSKELLELTSELEGLIEFSEDHEVSNENQIQVLLKDVHVKAEALLNKVRRAEVLPRVFIMGPVNAGKSTLFNKLYGQETVVVSSIPGTTRDGISRQISIAGRQIEISDSAGFGGEVLDGKALTLLLSSIRSGDRIVWMDPCCEKPANEISDLHQVLFLKSQADNNTNTTNSGWLPFSSVSGEGMAELFQFISATEKGSSSWRIERIVELIQQAITAAKYSDIALSAEIVGEILFEADQSDMSTDAVERALERFCVGK